MDDTLGILEGFDWEWIAVDADGCVAALTVVNGTPMPVSFGSREVLDETSDFIWALPIRGTADLVKRLPRPDDHMAFAERGLFAYDWSDVHRTTGDETNRYELMAVPRSPIHVSELSLSPTLKAAIWTADSVLFANSVSLSVPRNGFLWRAREGA